MDVIISAPEGDSIEERFELVEEKVKDLATLIRDWGIIEPETTLILGNVRRLSGELYITAEQKARADERARIAEGAESMRRILGRESGCKCIGKQTEYGFYHAPDCLTASEDTKMAFNGAIDEFLSLITTNTKK